jgi:O-methyltransferase
MLGPRLGRNLLRLAEDVERRGVPGDLVDCGVWNGGSSLLLASGAPSRPVWAFDSFEGMPETSAVDGEVARRWVGKVVGSEERVREGFREYALDNPLHVVKGWLDQTFPEHAERIGSIAVLHVDVDWYDSVRLVLRTLYPKLSPGGWVAVDDYRMWEGARLAVDEFRSEGGIEAPLIDGHYWQKPPDR